MNAFMIAGISSGVGKTTITIGLISAFKSLDLNVQPFKVGPDFIDTGYHSIVSGNPSINLDGWMLPESYNRYNFYYFSQNKDISIVEGVMGFYDGFSAIDDKGSSAEISKLLNIPVILIVNAQSIARSVAAIISGFESFDKHVNIKGVIFNNVSGENHYYYLRESVTKYCKAEPLGYFMKNDFPSLPSRHLGLVTVEDNLDFTKNLIKYSEIVKKRINLGKLLKITTYENQTVEIEKILPSPLKKKIKIAVAKDNAFCFYYYDNLKILSELGGEIIYFSPLRDKKLPDGISIIYFGGGYPELYAEELSQNRELILDIKNFSENYGNIYAECGGLIYLTRGVHTTSGKFFPFVGIFNDESIMLNRLKTLGYAEITTTSSKFFGKSGLKAKGHEFHYSYLKNNGVSMEKIYNVTMRRQSYRKSEGFLYKNTLGSYIHLHFGSNIDLIKNLYLRIVT